MNPETATAIANRLLTRALDPLDPYLSPERVAVAFVEGLDEAIRERGETPYGPPDRGYYEDHLGAYLAEVETFVGRILDERK